VILTICFIAIWIKLGHRARRTTYPSP
jgi:hypothetical protein